MLQTTSRLYFLLAFVVTLPLSGCGSLGSVSKTQTPPPLTKPVFIRFTDDKISRLELPVGSYQVPESQVSITGLMTRPVPQNSGVIGVLAQDYFGSRSGKHSVRDNEDALRLNLTEEGQRIADAMARSSDRFQGAIAERPNSNARALTVMSHVILHHMHDSPGSTGNNNVLAFVALRVTLYESNSRNVLWTNDYYAATGKPVPLQGEGSLTEDNGKLLKERISIALRRLIRHMLADISNSYPRLDENTVETYAYYPKWGSRMKQKAYLLTEDDEIIVVVPQTVDTMGYGGVNILDKEISSYTPNAKISDEFKAKRASQGIK